MIEFSDGVRRIAPSATVQMADTAAEIRRSGASVVSLAAGEPHFDTPQHIRAAANVAIEEGRTRYTPSDGLPELRNAIAHSVATSVQTTTTSNVIISSGAKQVIFNAFAASLNAGDEVLVLAPYWISYRDIANFFGATVKVVHTLSDQGFQPDLDEIRNAISPRTKWLVINSPNNPTGTIYSPETLRSIADIVLEKQYIQVLSDEIYEHIALDTPIATTFSQVAQDLRDRTLIVNGFSKSYCMTGWRIGYGVGNEAIIRQMSKVQSQSTTNASTISQHAAIAAISGNKSFMLKHSTRYRELRDFACSALDACGKLRINRPSGAFYLFPDMSQLIGSSLCDKKISSDVEFCEALLQQFGVAVVPGTAFGAPGFFRLSYACSQDQLREGCDRIVQAISQIQ